ncbi:hypothetical protein Fmac_032740 [Flemingia macrophylla]|uniref:Uncharacterized protein n=1 Tax=Flemingia macrophylla TaxID=520843 RepID=A0ABD1L5R5_9FABA
MGCNNSTLDRLPAVALCRERCKFVGEALRESYALADAHATHMHSLTTLGPTLCRFFNHFQPQPNPTCYHSSPSPPRLHYEFGNYAPSPPPPPPTSTWDFFNVFENLDKYQVPCSPTQNQAQNKSNFDSHNHNEATEPTTHAMEEIQILFQKASDSGNPISEMLHIGRLRYLPNIAVNPVPCKMMHVFTPSKHLNCMESSRKYQGVHIDKGRSYDENLCSTLNKLCMWEKKLYVEVKDGEKLRVLHEKKCRQLKRMNKKDADAHKIDSLEALIGILATKIKISLQVVDKISSTIRKLMEEDLWPQINRFILSTRFFGMWKEMLECYKSQYKEISEAISVDASSFSSKPSNSHLDELIKLKSEVQNWNLSFSDWIYAQKAHVKALNGWLVRCLPYEPEELLDDGTPPFSPATIGAPPVFVICNKWSRAMDILSEKPVTEALNGFMLNANELLEKHVSDLQQKLTLDKELEKKVKILETEERNMHKVVQARETMIPICRENNNVVHHSDLADIMGLLSGLKHVFDAMERFAASITRVYEVLCQQMEEE